MKKKDLAEFDKGADEANKSAVLFGKQIDAPMDLKGMIKGAEGEIKQYQKFILKCQKEILKDAKKSFKSEVKRFKKEELKKIGQTSSKSKYRRCHKCGNTLRRSYNETADGKIGCDKCKEKDTENRVINLLNKYKK